MKKLFILIAIIGLSSCAKRTSTYNSVSSRADSSIIKSSRIDTIYQDRVVTKRDSFKFTQYLAAPCDSGGLLRNGFEQLFNFGKFSFRAEVVNGKLLLSLKGEADSSTRESSYRTSDIDNSRLRTQKETKEVQQTIIVNKSHGWLSWLKILGWHLCYIPATIVIYEIVRRFTPLKRLG